MQKTTPEVSVTPEKLASLALEREVDVDFYLPPEIGGSPSLLLINDGQNLAEMRLAQLLTDLRHTGLISPVIAVGIHANERRKREYGVAAEADYLGRGDLAGSYTTFIVEELLPFLSGRLNMEFSSRAFAGFSLGGLSALDIVWNHPHLFSTVGVFSGSLWWRSLAQEDAGYHDDEHRIIHRRIRGSDARPGLRFYLQCGNMDETKDRNQNGIIDSIDDTLGLMRELEAKGYRLGKEVHYREMVDGRHDIPTWARAMPEFLMWAFPAG